MTHIDLKDDAVRSDAGARPDRSKGSVRPAV